ncbi:MAG: Tyrocidine synthase 3 [Candidatus Anoxychlamydiales bacterium]|nr:Tyrocidine synthase 3 [Candidatus Anoxychlamydiales bacterium]
MTFVKKTFQSRNILDEKDKFLSSEQYSIWLEQQLYPRDSVNQCNFVAKINDKLNLEDFQKAISSLVGRYEVLRTIFPVSNGVPIKKLVETTKIQLLLEECHHLNENEIKTLIKNNFERPFDLTRQAPIKFYLYKKSKLEYYFQMITHHIVITFSDYISLPIELAKLYIAEKEKKVSNLKNNNFEKNTFSIHKICDRLHQENAKDDRNYWKKNLSKKFSETKLPFDAQNKDFSRFAKKTYNRNINKKDIVKLKEIAHSNNTTFFSIMTTAFQVLLHKYTKQEEMIFGIPNDLIKDFRNENDFQQSVGYTVNILPLRSTIDIEEGFSTLLQKTGKNLHNMKKHKFYPFSRIREEFDFSDIRQISNPYNILVVSLKVKKNKEIVDFGLGKKGIIADIDGFKYESIGMGFLPTGRFNLVLAIVESSEGYSLSFHYNAYLFDLKSIQRLAQNYLKLLDSIIDNPEKKVAGLAILSDKEYNLQLDFWNNTKVTLDVTEGVVSRFEKIAKKQPNAIAIEFGGTKTNYGDLNNLANRLAHYLQKSGASKETVIGICIERSVELIAIILAIMKVGSTYLPIDPYLPKERIKFMLKDSQAEMLVLQSSLMEMFNDFTGKKIVLDQDNGNIVKENNKNLRNNFDPNDIAYILYTSGSTGQPKGVEVFHKSLNNLFLSIQKKLQVSHCDRWLALSNISFDVSSGEILFPLVMGITIILANQSVIKEPFLLIEAMNEKNKITFAHATPSMWQMLIDFGWTGSSNITILCSGEELPKTLANKLVRITKALWTLYGPTETTIWSSMKKIKKVNDRITIGKPIDNTSFYILDENKVLVPIGVPGELYIGGIGLARGYRNKAKLTNERFTLDPFDMADGKRIYKTGDLVRYLSNGEIEFLGRIDNQIKIHGYRIELGEIENIVKKCKGIQQVLVKIHEIKKGNKSIVVYYTGFCKKSDLDIFLRVYLPNYMLPSAYIHLKQFSLTHNGKIDHSQLPLPRSIDEYKENDPPRNFIQTKLLKIFKKNLSIDLMGIHSNFIAMGGNSLLAARTIFEINKTFNVNLPLNSLMEKPTVELLAKEIESNSGKESKNIIFEDQRKNKIELSFAQRQILLLEKLNENTSINSIPFIIRFRGCLKLKILQRVIDTIVQRHEILRTIFNEDLEVYAEILSKMATKIKYQDVSNLKNSKKLAKEIISKEAKKPFRLFSDKSLFRFILIKVESDQYWFFLNFHHIIFDGVSFNVFLNEMKILYEAFDKGLSSPLKMLQIRYSDYVNWVKKVSKTNRIRKQISWWKNKLSGAFNSLNFFSNKPRTSIQINDGSISEFSIEKSLLRNLKRISKDSETSLFMILLSIFYVLLNRYTKENDIITGIPVMGRDKYELNSLIGCFINTIPLRVKFSREDSFRDILKLIKNECIEALNNQEVPFELLIKNLKIKRSSNQSPLYQVMFNMLPELEVNQIGDLELEVQNPDRKMAHCDLSLSFQESSKGLLGIFEYNTELFEKDSIKRIVLHYKKITKEIINNIDCPINKLPILLDSELKKQMIEWNEQQIVYSNTETILQLFEKTAKKNPNDIAIIFENKKWTFEEINKQSNIVAHTLLSLGISSEDKIAVILERTPEFIIGILGILKAGGVYIPVDSLEPNDRINSILQDSNPFCILTNSYLKKRYINHKIVFIDKLKTKKTYNPNIFLSEKQLAYIIYTSGSTGKPKGVEIEHKSINDRVLWKKAAYPLDSTDVMLHTYSFNFDGSIINYFWPLCSGACLIITAKEEQFDAKALVNLIKQYNVTTMDLLPSLIQVIFEEKEISSCFSLKNVFSGGEALSSETIRLFYKKCSAKLYNTYGPTEATVEASVWQCKLDYKSAIAPIGKAIAGAKLYVLDRDQNIVPIGVPGELYIGGIGLARGYLNDPKLTKEKFIQDPFSKNRESRLYRTGDLTKYNSNGDIEFLGRIDSQVKIRGYRIDLKEIENSLLNMEIIKQAVVLSKGENLHKHLVAYVILANQMNEEKLFNYMKNYLKDHIPGYMIPQKIVILEKIPTLLNGKIDYKLLPEPNYNQNLFLHSKKREYRNKIEKDLYSIWKKVLELDFIEVTDNFFDIGGNSLLAMRLMTTIRNEMDITIPLISLFEHSSIESLANFLEKGKKHDKWSPIVTMHSRGKATPFFCIHPIGGGVWCYNELAKSWVDKRPFYAIQARGLESNQKPHEAIQDMAEEYVKNIQITQPFGPYVIGGWSFGGLVAAEVVNQLILKGEKVSLLVLIDTTANIEKFKKLDLEDDSLLLSQLTNHFKVLPESQSHISLKKQLLNFIDNGGKKCNMSKQRNVEQLIDLVKANYRSLYQYSIPKIGGNVALIKANENPENDKTLGWDKHAKQLKTFQGMGNHWSITQKDEVDHYSELLQKCFDHFKV